jgi:CRISPR-associated endonuclease Csn1
MGKRIFGFDLGITSIGWAVVDFSESDFYDPETGEICEGEIKKSGVRCFPGAENPKDGTSLAEPRRKKRLARRTCRRKARRMERLKVLFKNCGLVDDMQKDLNDRKTDVYARQVGGDVWNLRIKGLSEQLSKEELVRVLTHLAKHRGFKSYRKAVESEDTEGGKVLKAIAENKALLASHKTLAQIIVERAGSGKRRNYTSKDTKKAVYNNSIPRDEIKRELDMIYQAQKSYHLFTEDLYNNFVDIAFAYRPIGSVAQMVGYCKFEKNEKRAPKEAPTSELFVALTKINNMSVRDEFGSIRGVTDAERQAILDILKNTKTVKYSTLSRKVWHKKVLFADLKYPTENQIAAKDPEDKIFYEMKGWHKLKSLFSESEWFALSQQIPLLDQVMNVVACEKNDESIQKALQKLELSDDYVNRLTKLTSDKFLNLSLKALYNIVPYMQRGDLYNVACEKAGYDFRDNTNKLSVAKGHFLKPIAPENLTTVPVVNRTVAQFRKVFNAMVRRFGMPDQINIETGRELKKTFEERKLIKARNQENEETRNELKAELDKHNIEGKSQNILKYRLYLEQGGKCIYSGKTIDIKRLDENGYVDVDHILPYSRSLDNSYTNKVLCLSDENRKKGNKTPFEYLPSSEWEAFETRVRTLHNLKKENNLLQKNFIERELEFRERNAHDNSYISRYVKQYCEDSLDFSNSPVKNIKNRVQMRPGSLTDYLRHQWGLIKDRNANDKHHAQDAIVIACATQHMVQKLSSLSGIFENKYEYQEKKRKELGEEKAKAWYNYIKTQEQEPWPNFRSEVLQSLDKIFVSRPPRKKATGEVHDATIYTLNPNKKKYDKSKVKSGILVRGGLANNGDMLRTDVFVKKNKKGKDEFFLVPVYLSNMGKDLPNRAVVPNKDEKDWIIIDDTFHFKFSLYSDDLVRVTKSDGEILGYFCGLDRKTGAIGIEAQDRSWNTRTGVKTQKNIQKFIVTPLGEYFEVKQEKRQSLTNVKSNAQRHKEKMAKRQQKE